MARPQIASDEDILYAAHTVIGRRGPDAFTLAEVAQEVGLSRAAIILRFKSTQALKLTLVTKLVEQFAALIDVLPKEASGDSLVAVAAFIGTHAGSSENLSVFFSSYHNNFRDHEFKQLEIRRGEVMRRAVSLAMPKASIAHESAVLAFQAHISGSLIAGMADADTDLREYLVQRTMQWLRLAGIAYSEERAIELMSRHRTAASRRPAAAKKVLIAKHSTSKQGIKRLK